MPIAGNYDGSYDRSYNNTRNELGHLLRVDLNAQGVFTTDGTYNVSYGIGDDNFSFIDTATGTTKSFINPNIGGTWLAEGAGPGNYSWWGYMRDPQYQSPYYVGEMSAVLVRNGDGAGDGTTGTYIPIAPAAPVPEPAAAWLFGFGLICLAGIARMRRTIQ